MDLYTIIIIIFYFIFFFNTLDSLAHIILYGRRRHSVGF